MLSLVLDPHSIVQHSTAQQSMAQDLQSRYSSSHLMSLGLQENCAKQGLQPLEAFVGKIVQLYEMIVVRHGLMLVGQSFGMKTASHTVLAAALSDLREKVLCLIHVAKVLVVDHICCLQQCL